MNNLGKTNPQTPGTTRAWASAPQDWIEEEFSSTVSFFAAIALLRRKSINFVPNPRELKIKRAK